MYLKYTTNKPDVYYICTGLLWSKLHGDVSLMMGKDILNVAKEKYLNDHLGSRSVQSDSDSYFADRQAYHLQN